MDSTYFLPPTPTRAELYVGIFTEYIEGRSPYTRLTVASKYATTRITKLE